MADEHSYWEEQWLARDAQELYGRCRSLWKSCSNRDREASFHADSAPYLMASEFPWSRISGELIRNRSVMTIAGSGDLPLFFCRQGARRIVAVDISRLACFYNELKRAAVRTLQYRSALGFFLAGLPCAEGFLASRGEPAFMKREERQRIYKTLRHDLSHSACIHWDREFGELKGTESPFRSFRGPTGLCFLDQIPYLANEESYESWKGSVRPYPLMNLPLQQAVAASPIRFDILYVSNILEYWREDHLLRGIAETYSRLLEVFLASAWEKLSPGGCIFFYAFTAKDGRAFKKLRNDLEILDRLGGCEESVDITYCSESLSGSRFRNTLTGFRKPFRPTS
jgi:hypothetical protein